MKRIAHVAAVAAAIGMMGLVGCNKNDEATNTPANNNSAGQQAANDVQNAADKTGQALNNAAHETGNALSNATTRASDMAQQASNAVTSNENAAAPDATSIRRGMATAVDDALTKDGFASLVKDFTTNAQDRIGQAGKQDFADLNGLVAQIQGEWKSKYGNDFDISQSALDNPTITIRQGGYAGNNAPNSSQSGAGTANADRNTAVVTFVAFGSGQQIVVPMTKAGILSGWKIDVPNSVDAQKLHDNLMTELNTLKDSSTWPSDQNDAYRVVAGHVLAAVMNLNLSK